MKKLIVFLIVGLLLWPIAALAQPDLPQGWLGIAIEDSDTGVVVTSVMPESPADQAGLLMEDVILSVDGESVADSEVLIAMVRAKAPGDVITLEIQRGDETLEIEVTLGTRPDELTAPNVEPPQLENRQMRAFLGVGYEMQEEGGALITSVVPDSPAEQAELAVGDVIVKVDDTELTPRRDLGRVMSEYQPGDTVTVSILRDGESLEVEVTLAEQFGAIPVPPVEIVPAVPPSAVIPFTNLTDDLIGQIESILQRFQPELAEMEGAVEITCSEGDQQVFSLTLDLTEDTTTLSVPGIGFGNLREVDPSTLDCQINLTSSE